MATKYECDKCKNLLSSSQDIAKIELPMINGRSEFTHESYSRDICLGCAKEIAEFVRSKPGTKDGRT